MQLILWVRGEGTFHGMLFIIGFNLKPPFQIDQDKATMVFRHLEMWKSLMC